MSLANELDNFKKKFDEFLLRLISRGEPAILYEASSHLIKAGGKRLRPFLVLKSCELVGGKEEDAMPFAISLELLHNFTLVHDDIMDGSEKRRDVPTVHVKWGIPMAINAGDLLFAEAYSVILRESSIDAERKLRALSVLAESTISVCRGQALDLLLSRERRYCEKDYLEMIELKTASLLEASAKIGGIVGGGNEDQISRLSSYGLNLGMAFQITDDILGIFGKEEVTKKPVGDDIREGKSILIVYALKNLTASETKQLLSIVGKRNASSEEIERAIDLIERSGALSYAETLSKEYARRAKELLKDFPSSKAKTVLLELADFVVCREY